MRDKMKGAEYLFDEIGLISDSIVAEAASYRANTYRRGSLRKILVAAAAMMALVTVLMSTLLIGYLRNAFDTAEDGGENAEIVPVYSESISEALTKAQESDIVKYCSYEETELFDGVTKLIWQTEGADGYYVIEITDPQNVSALKNALADTYRADRKADGSVDESVRIWISEGDGRVVSPQLEKSEGNVGYGELFSYSPEIVPSGTLVRFVDDLIS